jgi:precorrin-6A synthase
MAGVKRKVLVIGIGAGDPDYLTVQAIDAMNRASVFFIPDKGAGKGDLARVREEICARFVRRSYRTVPFAMPARRAAGDAYEAAVCDWHDAMAQVYGRLLREELDEGGCGAFLVWGDPSLYDSTMRILDRLNETGGLDLDYEVIPGITAVQALAARHRVALNTIGQAVAITTGRRLAEGFPGEADSVVVMLDAGDGLRSVQEDADIWWGANIGTADEVLVAGRLSDVAGDIERTKAETRAKHGWVMDTYLLRRRPGRSGG